MRRRLSRGPLGSGLFGLLWRHCLVYNQCWEDPAVDRKALVLTPEDRVMVITSAGCNALDYAVLGARIVAVDANPRQNHLLELKRAGIRALDFDDFFALFGQGGSGRTREIYAGLRHALPDDARAFWDREVRLFEPGAGRSFYYRGTAGLVALLLNWHIDRVSRTRRIVDRILDARDLPAQIGIYRAELRDRLLGKPLLKLLGSPGVLSLLGVPDPQRRMIHGGSGGFAGFLRRAIDHVMSVALLRDNCFWSVYVNGRYRPGRVLLDPRPYGTHADCEGTADRILFSYSLSMIPPFLDVLDRARLDLRPAGRIAVVDFLDAVTPVAAALSASHVFLGPARLLALRRLFPRHRVSVRSVGLWRFFLFVGEAAADEGASAARSSRG